MLALATDEIVTQIIYFELKASATTSLEDVGLWKHALDVCEQGAGIERVYWGRSLEHPEYGQLHIVRRTFEQHRRFLNSDAYEKFVEILGRLSGSIQTVRHAKLASWGPADQALARGAPFTGTAIYFNTTDAWDEGAWPLWTHVVRHVDGCLGGAGGPLLEPVETVPGPLKNAVSDQDAKKLFKRCNIVYVGWETTEKHHEYHQTKQFAEHSVILRCGNDGFAEYGHIVFEGSREKVGGVMAKL